MKHEAGLQTLSAELEPGWLSTDNIKMNAIGHILENEPRHVLPGGLKRVYHLITKDLLANEIFRRIDPEGRTMGEYMDGKLQQELELDVHVRVANDQLLRVQDQQVLNTRTQLANALKSKKNGRLTTFDNFDNMKLVVFYKGVLKRLNKTAPCKERGENQHELFTKTLPKELKWKFNNFEAFKTGELVSASCFATARGLARFAAFMANRGSLDGKRLLSEETWEEFHSEATVENQVALGMRSIYTKGGVAEFDLDRVRATPRHPWFKNQYYPDQCEEAVNLHRQGYFGTFGYGGAVFNWHPELQIGFAYIPCDLFLCDFFDLKGSLIQKAVVDICRQIESN